MNVQQYNFVTAYLRTGDKIQSYKSAYNSESTNYHSLESAANRLLRQPEIAATIRGIQESIRAEVEAELKAELKHELLTIQEKRELLAQIARGEMTAEQNYRGKNCSQCTQFIKPTINQMLKAIDLDSKLAGHYGNYPKEKRRRTSQQNTTTLSSAVVDNLPKVGVGDKQSIQTESTRSPNAFSVTKDELTQQNTTTLSSSGGGVTLQRDGGGLPNIETNEPLRLSVSAVKEEGAPQFAET